MQLNSLALSVWWLVLSIGVTGCSGLSRERLVYDKHDIQVGIQYDPSTDHTTPPTLNRHPAQVTVSEFRELLGVVRVSGYSGTVAGLIVKPQPIRLFKDEELTLIAGPIAMALSQAGPNERVFFSLPNLQAPYEKDRTAGALFLRGGYLHLLLTDHNAFVTTDNGGGDDEKDWFDIKGMKLSVSRPAQAAEVPPKDIPHWGPFEKVTIALNVQETLAALPTPTSGQTRPVFSPQTPPSAAQNQADDLRLQIRELTDANQDLRSRLKEQAQEMEALKEELVQIRQLLKKGKATSPSKQKSSVP
jgi:hypothetical protein